MAEISLNTSFSPCFRNHLYEFTCTSIKFGMLSTSLMRAKLIRVFFPSCTGLTFTIGLITPFIYFENTKHKFPFSPQILKIPEELKNLLLFNRSHSALCARNTRFRWKSIDFLHKSTLSNCIKIHIDPPDKADLSILIQFIIIHQCQAVVNR